MRLGIEPTSSWILVRFITTEPQQELPRHVFLQLKVGKHKFVTASTQNMASEDHVEWMVDNPAILSIAASGSKNSKVTFTGLGEGDAVITGTVPGGNSVSIFVHVTK